MSRNQDQDPRAGGTNNPASRDRECNDDAVAAWPQFRTLTARGFHEVIASPFFVAILLAGVLFLILNALQLETIFGTRTWPMAWKVIEILGGSFSLFVVILITLYAGELVWRERDLKLDQVVDATPVPSWIGYAAKLTSLVAMVTVLLGTVWLAGMVTQAMLGFFRFEPGLYAEKLVGMQLVDYVLLSVLALAVHTLVNHKYTGHFILVLLYVGVDLMPLLGFEHSLGQFGSDLGTTYSDMNQHGWYLTPFMWFKVYWGGVAILMAVVSNLLWPRGVDGRVRQRFHAARLRMRFATVAVATVGVLLASSTGAYIYYNTNVLNEYRSSTDQEKLQAKYEKTYRQYLDLPQPRITSVNLEVDLFPGTGDVFARGTYAIVNRTDELIKSVHVLVDPEAEIKKLEFATPATVENEDADAGYRIGIPGTTWPSRSTTTQATSSISTA